MTLANATTAGQHVVIEKTDTTVNTVTVTGNIRGMAGSVVLTWAHETVELLSKADGSWWPIAGDKTKASLDSAYGLAFLPVAGETTVINPGYPVGDVRRYGVMPDDLVTSPTTQGTRIINAINANALIGVETYFPAGYYTGGVNVLVSNVRLRMQEGAEFGGVIHIGRVTTAGTLAASTIVGATSISSTISIPSGTQIQIDANAAMEIVTTTGAPTGSGPYTIPVPALAYAHGSGVFVSPSAITDIQISGPAVTYDRFGIFMVNRFRFDDAVCKSDGTKNQPNPGSRGRGCHFYNGALNVIGRSITVDDFDAASPNNQAAIAIDGFNNNPANLTIGLLRVKKTDTHGVYVTGLGHTIGAIVVDEWAATAYPDAAGGLQDSDSLAQTKELKGVWINRCGSTRIDKIDVKQGLGARTDGVYDVLIDETGINSHGSVSIGLCHARNVRANSRGISFGDATYPTSANCDIQVQDVRVTVEAARAAIAGFGAVSVEGTAKLRADVIRVRSTQLDTDGYHQGASAVAAVGYIDLGDFRGRGVLTLGKLTAEVVRGRRVAGNTNCVEIQGSSAAGSRIGVLDMAASTTHPSRGLVVSATDVSIGKAIFGPFATSGGTVLVSVARFTMRDFYLGGTALVGVGLSFTSGALDMLLERGTVTGYATGASSSGGVGGVVIGVKVTGNTTNTNIPNSTFTELGNTTFQL